MTRATVFIGAAALCALLASASWAASGRPGSVHDAAPRPVTPAAIAACSDAYDPNDSCLDPLPTLGAGSYPGLKLPDFYFEFDADWFNVHLRHNEKLTATMTFSAPADDAEIALNAGCGSIVAYHRSPGTVHTISYTNTGADANFRLVTKQYNDICLTYTLDLSIACGDALDPNDVCASAAPIGPGSYPGLAVDWFFAGDFDWYKVHVRRSQKLVLDLAYTNALGNIDGDIWADCSFTTLVAAFFDVADGDHVEVSNDGPDADWFIRIGNEDNTCNTYSMTIAIDPTANLDGVTPIAGWGSPVIPRNAPGGYPPTLSATLDGNVADTYISWSLIQTGAKATPQWHDHFFVDDEFAAFSTGLPEPVYPGDYYFFDIGAFSIRGGRHTLRSFGDPFDNVPETNEADNQYSEQFVWSPLPVTNASPVTRSLPPPTGLGPISNNDGFQYDRDLSNYDGVIAIAGRNPGDDYDLLLYGDYSGSTSGFSTLLGASGYFNNATDFVVCNYNYLYYTMFPAAVRYATSGGGSDYTIDTSEDQTHLELGLTDHLWANEVMGPGGLADVYDVYALSGQTIYLTLRRKAGPSDMGFEIFHADAGVLFSRGFGLAIGAPITPSIDALTFPVPTTGYYSIVVYRTNGTTSDQSLTYDFAVSWAGPLAAPTNPGASAELSFAGATPNPLHGGGEFAFSLPASGHASLELFDASGRLAGRLADGEFPAGPTRVAWDGRGTDGGRLGPGVYWVRFAAAGRSITRHVVVLE